MNNRLRLRFATCLLLSITCGSVLALPPGHPRGEEVRSIPDADQISDWTALDNQRVIVNVNTADSYLLTLKQQCHGLGWAQNITVTMSNNTIWAGFDAISADGRQCSIDSISKVTPAELLELKSQ